jgi:hypothetical protein
MADGSERAISDTPTRLMTPEEVEEAARAGPGARPMTAEQLAKARRICCVRQVQQIGHGKRARLNSDQGDIPLFDRNRTIPSSRPAVWQSAARSGSQGCRRDCGGTGGAGAQRP